MAADDTGRRLTGALLETALIVTPLALGYFAGIAYLDEFLAAFSISIHEVDAPVATVVAHSFNVFTHKAFLAKLVLLASAVGLLALAVQVLRGSGGLPGNTSLRPLFLVALPAAVFIAFVNIKASAAETARVAAQRIWAEGTAVVVPRRSLDLHDKRLGVRQRLRLTACLRGRQIKHVIATPSRSYALCVIDREGFLLAHMAERDVYLPVRHLAPCGAPGWRTIPFCTTGG
ncbi:hypothetical protein [Stappia sp.]|uniref:hypothetical protein n=1 Tax=Stappia sp. TaxID=1870903 RepID=UPI0032D8B68F